MPKRWVGIILPLAWSFSMNAMKHPRSTSKHIINTSLHYTTPQHRHALRPHTHTHALKDEVDMLSSSSPPSASGSSSSCGQRGRHTGTDSFPPSLPPLVLPSRLPPISPPPPPHAALLLLLLLLLLSPFPVVEGKRRALRAGLRGPKEFDFYLLATFVRMSRGGEGRKGGRKGGREGWNDWIGRGRKVRLLPLCDACVCMVATITHPTPLPSLPPSLPDSGPPSSATGRRPTAASPLRIGGRYALFEEKESGQGGRVLYMFFCSCQNSPITPKRRRGAVYVFLFYSLTSLPPSLLPSLQVNLTGHGLWPNNNDGTYPTSCGGAKFDDSIPEQAIGMPIMTTCKPALPPSLPPPPPFPARITLSPYAPSLPPFRLAQLPIRRRRWRRAL